MARYFLDAEFFENGTTIDLISIAIVCEDGRELHCVNADFDIDAYERWAKTTGDDWIDKNVLRHLPLSDWLPKQAIRDKVTALVGDDPKPEFWGFVSAYDWVIVCQLYGRMIDMPKNFPKHCNDLKQWQAQLGAPKFPKPANAHDALVDARWNRDYFNYLDLFDRNRHA